MSAPGAPSRRAPQDGSGAPGWLQELHAKYGEPKISFPDAVTLAGYRRECWVWFVGGLNHNLGIDDYGSYWKVSAGAGPLRAEFRSAGTVRPADATIRLVLVLAGLLEPSP